MKSILTIFLFLLGLGSLLLYAHRVEGFQGGVASAKEVQEGPLLCTDDNDCPGSSCSLLGVCF